MSFGGTEITSLGGDPAVLIESYGTGSFRIGGSDYHGSVLIINGAVQAWEVLDFASLKAEDFAAILAASPELCFLGCGAAMARPPAIIAQKFIAADIALDFMATPAACRSYNVATGEGRITAAALLVL